MDKNCKKRNFIKLMSTLSSLSLCAYLSTLKFRIFVNHSMIHSYVIVALFCFALLCFALFANAHHIQWSHCSIDSRNNNDEWNKQKKPDTHKLNKELKQKKCMKTCVPIVYVYVLFFPFILSMCASVSVCVYTTCTFESIVCKAPINYGTASRLDDVWLNSVYIQILL